MSTRLAELIGAACAEAHWESSGRFTLDYARALERTRELLGQVPPGTWLRRLVRCGVAAGAESLALRFEPKGTHFYLYGPSPARLSHQVLNGLTLGDELSERHPTRQLSMAILSNIAMGDEVEWGCWDGQRGEVLRLTPAGLQSVSPCARPPWKEAQKTGFFFLSKRSRANAVLAKKEAAHFQVLSRYCPIPVVLQDRLLRWEWQMESGPDAGWLQGLVCPTYRLGEVRVPEHVDLTPLPPQPDKTPHAKRFRSFDSIRELMDIPAVAGPGQVLLSVGPNSHLAALIALPIALEGHAVLHWVIDGTVLSEPRADLCPGCIVLLSGSGLETDFSGIRLIDSPSKQARIDVIRGQVARLVNAVHFALPRVDWVLEARPRKVGILIGGPLLLAGAGLALGGFGVVPLIPAQVLLKWNMHRMRQLNSDWLKQNVEKRLPPVRYEI